MCRVEKIPLFFFAQTPSLTQNAPHSLSVLYSVIPMLPATAGQAVGLNRVRSSRVWIREGAESLHFYSYQSSMDTGDLLGDRFWLSPKKGKWEGLLSSFLVR